MCLQETRVFREAEQVVFGQELREVLDRKVFVVFFEFEEIELLPLSVVDVDGAGGGVFRMDLEEEDASWHLNPSCGDGVSHLQKGTNGSVDIGFGGTESQLGKRVKRVRDNCSFASLHGGIAPFAWSARGPKG